MNKLILTVILLFSVLSNIQPASAQALHWLSKPEIDMGPVLNYGINSAKISTNGRYATFYSYSSNLVINDNNATADVFIRDLLTGETKLVTTNISGQQAQEGYRSFSAATSDGRYVAFVSTSSIYPNAGSFADDYLYIKDMQTGVVTNHSNYDNTLYFDVVANIHLSDDAQFVTFTTNNTIVPLHVSSFDTQAYRKNLTNQTYELLSISLDGLSAANDDVTLIDVSDNGRYVLIATDADNLTTDTLNNSGDNLYILDQQTGTKTLVNITPTGDSSAFSTSSLNASISNTGSVAFTSQQSDLVLNDNNNQYDAFYFQNGTISRINLNNNGQELLDASTAYISISGDGSRIVFAEKSADLFAGDSNDNFDLFSYQTNTGQITLVSLSLTGTTANNYSLLPELSTNGNRMVFISQATDLTADPSSIQYSNMFHYNFNTALMKNEGQVVFNPNTTISSVNFPRISSDQKSVIYVSKSPNFVTEPTDDDSLDLFLLDRTDNTHSRIAHKIGTYINDISASGNYIVFSSRYTQPDASIDLDATHVFLFDRLNNNFTQIDEGLGFIKVNNNGVVVFETNKSIVANDNNQATDIYAFNSASQSISLISKDLNGEAAGGNSPDIGGNGNNTWITFVSNSANLISQDTNGVADVFLVKYPNGTISLVSQTSSGTQADASSSIPAFSEDASTIAFLTGAQNLTTDDYSMAGSQQVLSFDRINLTHSLASNNDQGLPLFSSNPSIFSVSISDSGRYISYDYEDEGLFNPDFSEDTDQRKDIILFDKQNQSSRLISKKLDGTQTNNRSEFPQITEDLSVSPPLIGVVFESEGGQLTNLESHPGHQEILLYQQGGPDLVLSINVVGAGSISGTLGINCTEICQYDFALGTELTLVATPANDYQFMGWQVDFGDCNDDSNPCFLNMDREKTLTAIFTDSSDIIFNNGFE